MIMENKEKYYKTRVVFEVISKDAPFSGGAEDLYQAITSGDCSGAKTECTSVELNREECAEALVGQGSDPSFLLGGLDEEDDSEEDFEDTLCRRLGARP